MTPMLFMGEEWGAKAPFPFFCDFNGDLADAVRKGRRSEYAGAYAKYGDEVPDPLDKSTFDSAMLDWDARNAEPGRARLEAGAGPARHPPPRNHAAACGCQLWRVRMPPTTVF